MDPRSEKLVLELQIEDVDTFLVVAVVTAPDDEITAFRATRAELVNRLAEVNDLVAVIDLLQKEHRERADFQRLVAEERQAQGKCMHVIIN